MQSVRVPSSSCSSSTHFCGRAGDFWPEMQRKLSLNVTTSFRAQQQIDCNKIEPKVTIRGGCFRDKINTQDSSRLTLRQSIYQDKKYLGLGTKF